MSLIKVPGGGDHWVNPDHVTSIEPLSAEYETLKCKVWVKGHSGYGTYSIDSTKSAALVAAFLNQNEVHNTTNLA